MPLNRSPRGVEPRTRQASLFRVAALFLALAFALVSPREAVAAVTVTPTTGGTNLTVGTFAPLTGPDLAEANPGEIGIGIIILRAPTGFEFDPSRNVTATVSTASGNCNAAKSLQLNGAASQTVTPTTTGISINVSRASDNPCRARITWSNIFVKATASGSGNITKAAGGSAITGVTNGTTSFGALSAASSLTLTLSTNTADFGTGLGPDGAASSLPATSVYPDGNTGSYYVRNGAAGSQAVSVTVKSTAPYTASASAAENTGTAGMRISNGSLRWALGDMTSLAAAQGGKPFTTTPDATVFNQASSCASGQPKQQGECTFRYDYGLRVLWTDTPGAFSSIVTYSAQQ